MAYAIRPLSFGEILDTAFRLVRDRWWPLLAIGILLWLPVTLLEDAVAPYLAAPQSGWIAAIGVEIFIFALGGVIYGPFYAATTILLTDTYLERPTGLGEALRRMRGMLWRFVGASGLAMALVALGLIVLVIPGVWLMMELLLVDQVLAAEGLAGTAALRRSRELMRNHRRRGFVLLFLVLVLLICVSSGTGWMLAGMPAVEAAVERAMMMVSVTFETAVCVVFYFDVICRREAFDIEHLAQLVEARGVAPSAA